MLTLKEVEFAKNMGLARNAGKKNQTVSRGWTPEEKHIMGCLAELTVEKLFKAKMNWEVLGSKGDKSEPDGVLPDGRNILVKALGKPLQDVWIPLVCLRKAEPTDIVAAVRVYMDTHSTEFLGWISVEEFLSRGRINESHKWKMESKPGVPLDKDICMLFPVKELNSFEEWKRK